MVLLSVRNTVFMQGLGILGCDWLSSSNNGDPASLSITADLLCDQDDNILDLTLIEE